MVFVAPEEAIIATVPAVLTPSAEGADAATLADSLDLAPADVPPAEQPLGPQADPRTFLRDEDFPRWIRELPTLPPRPVLPAAVIVPPPVTDSATLAAPLEGPVPLLVPSPDPPSVVQETSQEHLGTVEAAESPQAPTPSPAVPAAPTNSPVRRREAWETPLLVVLVVGVVAAVIWALLVNGLIGRGL